jgi:hypothetical protein
MVQEALKPRRRLITIDIPQKLTVSLICAFAHHDTIPFIF